MQPLRLGRKFTDGVGRTLTAFVPVSVAAEMPACGGEGGIEIFLAGGQRVRVTGIVHRQQLADVLGLLQGAQGC